MRILVVTTEYPNEAYPQAVPFIARDVRLLREAGLDVDIFTFRGRRQVTNYIDAWFQVHKLLKKKRYDLVHAQFSQSAVSALFPKPVPLIVTFRGSDVEGIVNFSNHYTFQGKILQIISQFVALKADECILVSKSLARKLPKRTYHIIPSGVDLELFKPYSQKEARQKLGFSLSRHYVLFGGNPDQPVKRIGLAQEVMKMVQSQFPDVELVILNNRLHSEIPAYLNACDVLLLTSIHEGSPNVVKEALACNLPIVSTNVGDVKERIGKIEGCHVCDSDDKSSLATAVIGELIRGGRIDGRKHIIELDERFTINGVLDVYMKVLGERNKK